MDEKLSKNMEDYLEAIYIILKENPVARVKEIADRLGVKKSSVTNALKQLSEKNLINYDRYSHITLTDEGRKYAKEIYHKHTTMTKFLVEILCVDKKRAEENACRMEHVIDKDIFEKFERFLSFFTEHDIECLNIKEFINEEKKREKEG
ncbi:transcriptional regulator, MntR family [Deferribacter desulfuricans SSM1]|uniref:Transcriptional regulator MntR n=1 Tax=Deferribacter desulfuricans (strain DSM 14783 / JCM 11476 / NBRC 101012 / SSM1) TaxID=639282 RepID=D3PDS9_DEFDS|nr:metal-dependent transcriptional regulator [Deferribacter desulfuricans]BAI80752.1 transcriptional regulator, MntR family [Deferribacter desulfuricans SSM1]